MACCPGRISGRRPEAGAELMVAEHDNPSDFARFAENAMQAMRSLEGV